MTKTLTALAAASTIALAAVATPQQAEARGRGGAVAAGVIGGIALGAIIASQARGGYHYGGGPAYYGGPVYYHQPRCWWQRQRVYDGYGYWHVRKIRVCR
ncbi:MAG: hypothetical protein AB7O50_03465 [Pseudolabrys sp.]